MIAVPKRPRPHQARFEKEQATPDELPLKQQLITQMARGDTVAAEELRQLLRLNSLHRADDAQSIHEAGTSGGSYATWLVGEEVIEELLLTATRGARELFEGSSHDSSSEMPVTDPDQETRAA